MTAKAVVIASLKAMTIGVLGGVMLTAAMAPAVALAPASAVPKVLADGVGAKSGRVEGMHKTRFIEIFLAHRDPKTGKLVAECYNSMFASPRGIPASKDTAPQALVEGLDFARMKTDFGVLGASLNGPKLWLPDWSEMEIGVKRDFNGIKTAWVAQLDTGGNTGGVAEGRPTSRWPSLGKVPWDGTRARPCCCSMMPRATRGS
jgi:hypothetical protein